MTNNDILSAEEISLIDRYWRAANYLSVGQIYLLDNPLLKRPLAATDVKPRLLGHWGTTPGLNFLYAHLNRLIQRYELEMIYITGPGHGGPALVAQSYLEGTYTETYPEITQDEVGMKKLFRQFSFPGGIPSHVAPETPGSIHEGGELGYALSHAYGAAFDNPKLFVACVVGDGEAETGPLATSWHSNKFLNLNRDGVVLPILHLNGYKIANPTVFARMPKEELLSLFVGYGYKPYFIEARDPENAHREFAAILDGVYTEILRVKGAFRATGIRQPLPMIIFKSPKGWTGPREIHGCQIEDTWRSHQVPIDAVRNNPENLLVLESWLKSYRVEELFDANGEPKKDLSRLVPRKRMSASPHANGGVLLRDLRMPSFKDFAVPVTSPGTVEVESTRILGKFLAEILRLNAEFKNFRVFGPDETASNRLGAVLEATDKVWVGEKLPTDEHLAADGRVMEILSEHTCQGWLEGYLLTGRHGFFSCYEAFIHIIDSMFNQHAKWLKTSRHISWRRPIASLNYLLTSHVWRQDHNGFSHQDPGFIDHVVNKKAEVVRVYLPPDANTLLSVADHCLRSRNYVNVIVAGKQPALQYLNIDDAEDHCRRGMSIWKWASTDKDGVPDVVLACCGEIPTLETLAAAKILREKLPELKVRVVNVVDLMSLQPKTEHPHGLSTQEFDDIFTKDRPVIFAFHGYPWLIHRLCYKQTNHDSFHVRGYIEEGTTTTPFDMVVLNKLDRFHLVIDVLDRVPGLSERCVYLKEEMRELLDEHRRYICENGEDMETIRKWRW